MGPLSESGAGNCSKGERVTRLELATSSLARRCSTTELHPHFEREGIMSTGPRDARLLSVVAAPLGRRNARNLGIRALSGARAPPLRPAGFTRPKDIARPMKKRVLVEH